jgi:hypothetical protein
MGHFKVVKFEKSIIKNCNWVGKQENCLQCKHLLCLIQLWQWTTALGDDVWKICTCTHFISLCVDAVGSWLASLLLHNLIF